LNKLLFAFLLSAAVALAAPVCHARMLKTQGGADVGGSGSRAGSGTKSDTGPAGPAVAEPPVVPSTERDPQEREFQDKGKPPERRSSDEESGSGGTWGDYPKREKEPPLNEQPPNPTLPRGDIRQ
jgi:hypothetical protein